MTNTEMHRRRPLRTRNGSLGVSMVEFSLFIVFVVVLLVGGGFQIYFLNVVDGDLKQGTGVVARNLLEAYPDHSRLIDHVNATMASARERFDDPTVHIEKAKLRYFLYQAGGDWKATTSPIILPGGYIFYDAELGDGFPSVTLPSGEKVTLRDPTRSNPAYIHSNPMKPLTAVPSGGLCNYMSAVYRDQQSFIHGHAIEATFGWPIDVRALTSRFFSVAPGSCTPPPGSDCGDPGIGSGFGAICSAIGGAVPLGAGQAPVDSGVSSVGPVCCRCEDGSPILPNGCGNSPIPPPAAGSDTG